MSIDSVGDYLKRHTEAFVKEFKIETACEVTGKSKAMLGRHYSDNLEHVNRFMQIDSVAGLEDEASYSSVMIALSKLIGETISLNRHNDKKTTDCGVNSDFFCLASGL